MTETISYKSDCRYFRGDVPCAPHKREGVHCADCPHYAATDRNILIIKLGAIGDVIRTTPLLAKLKSEFPTARIWWLTHTPEILPSGVDVKMPFDLRSIVTLGAMRFDLALNLDKDREACALLDRIEASTKKGFTLRNGVCAPIDADATPKFLTGIFDDVNKANTKSYLEELFEICGYTFSGEEYLLDVPSRFSFPLDHSKQIVGLNTGCGGRWTSRLWADERWIGLAKNILAQGFTPLFLGGEQEHEKNMRLASASGGQYLGHFPLPQFLALMNECDLIVSAVTMAMHFAIALKKKLLLFNNIFNKHEFELYGRGEIIEPTKECTCFFLPTCTNEEYKCMEHITVDRVADRVAYWLKNNPSVSSAQK